jgi:hypothetical protein
MSHMAAAKDQPSLPPRRGSSATDDHLRPSSAPEALRVALLLAAYDS